MSASTSDFNGPATTNANANVETDGTLIARGYEPVAVDGKRPVADGWQSGRVTAERLAVERAAYPHATNTGLRTGRLVGVDIDLRDIGHAAAIGEVATEILGPSKLVRFGSKGKLVCYRNETPIRKVTIAGTVEGKRTTLVEILGDGQQFVAYGVHPTTGRPYDWEGGDWGAEPSQTPVQWLFEVTPQSIREFAARAAERLTELGYSEVKVTGDTGERPEQATPSALSGKPLSPKQIEAMLAKLPPDCEYGKWRNIGAALHATDCADPEFDMFGAFVGWSSRGDKYDSDEDCWTLWRSMPPKVGGVGTGTLIHLARAAGYTGHADGTPMEETFAGYAETLKAEHDAAQPDLDNPDMSILRLGRLDPPTLPIEVLGPEWKSWVEDTAEAQATAPDYVAGGLLANASVLIGNARWPELSSSGWNEPPTLYVALLGDSGASKTPATKTLNLVMSTLEARMGQGFNQDWINYQNKQDVYEAERKLWKSGLSNVVNVLPPEQIAVPQMEEPVKPEKPRLKTDDATPEKTAMMIRRAAPKGLLFMADELATLLGTTNYSRHTRQFLLTAYGGLPHTPDRATRETDSLSHLTIAVLGGTQPDKLAEMIAGAPDDGFWSRFCFFFPAKRKLRFGTRRPNAEWALAALDHLRRLEMVRVEGEQGEPRFVPLHPAAHDILEKFSQGMDDLGELRVGMMKSALAKSRGLALRLSLVLEYLWWCGRGDGSPEPAQVSEGAVRAAIRLVSDYLMPMAERAYGATGAAPVDTAAMLLARWIRQTKATKVHSSHVVRKVRLPGIATAEAFHAAAAVLVRAGWLSEPVAAGGRGRTEASYPVNPKVLEGPGL